uniref:GUN4-like domain-containing protein n=1 Tax=Kalanchoe fedtschenkoi TaxID=63787 RepID=A0A7N0TUS5_KALFE
MAATTTNSLHRHHSLPRLLPHPTNTSTAHPTFLKPPHLTHTATVTSLISHPVPKTKSFRAVFSSSSASTAAVSAEASSTSLDLLATHLAAQDFRQADEETRRLLIALAGEAAVKRGYVYFSEVQFINSSDLKAIDDLWLKHSNNKFGYSVQKGVWEKSTRDFTTFFIRVGWMKKLDTEVTQYIYRAFPNEFTWELTPETPVGHLPLTNALRGTQLLNCVLNHPAFDDVEGKADEDDVKKALLAGTSKPLSKRVVKSDYTF